MKPPTASKTTPPATTPATADLPSENGACLKSLLRELKLERMEALLDEEVARFVQADEPVTNLLVRLLAQEVHARRERRIERMIRESKLPERKLLDDFAFEFQPSVNKTMILQLATMAFVKTGQGILFAGSSGTGKSFLAKALGLLGCRQCQRVRYTTAADMLTDLHAGLADDSIERKLKAYIGPDLLVVDELGFDRLEQDTARNAGLFFKVIDGRYRRVASTIITTNIDFEALGRYLGDPVATTSIVDRMLHHSVVITINGPSWRSKESDELNRRQLQQANQSAGDARSVAEPVERVAPAAAPAAARPSAGSAAVRAIVQNEKKAKKAAR